MSCQFIAPVGRPEKVPSRRRPSDVWREQSRGSHPLSGRSEHIYVERISRQGARSSLRQHARGQT